MIISVMTYLIGSCGTYNTLKPLLNWKLCSKVIKTSITKSRFSYKWSHFTKRKPIINTDKPLSVFGKISLGISTGIGLKLLNDNKAFCLTKTNRTEWNHVLNTKQEPDFNWKKFFKLLQSYWPELLGAILAAIVCALLNIQIPIALGNLIDIISKNSVGSKTFFKAIKKPIIYLLSYYSLQSLFTFFYIALLANVGEGVAKTMRVQLFSSVLDQDISFFDENRTGEILNRLTVDIHDFKNSFKMVISQGLKNITQIIGCSVSLIIISPPMAGILIVAVLSAILAGTLIGSLLRQLSHEAKAQSAKITLHAEEAISNIRTVRSFSMEEFEKKILEEQAEICRDLNVKLGYGIGLFQAGTNLFLNGVVLGTISLGGYMMSLGNISGGELMAFLASVQVLQRSFTHLSLLFGVFIKGKHAGARLFEVIDLPPGKTMIGGRTIPYHSLIPSIGFKDVVFSYPCRRNKEVLKEINLNIPEGKTVAIVGASGSGKSTLAWLLERFYDVNEGTVFIGGKNIKNLNSVWLRKNVIGFISQEPVLFATTVMENIRFGKPSATDQEVIEAAKQANAHEFIEGFPDGYNTMVGERGVTVSGGQKQRIAIARALLKNPSILILDEATSALDTESERAVQNALDNVTESRTTIIIAHRLSTIKNADLIVVLHEGVILESGTHHELLAKKGMYANLVSQQVGKN